MGLICKLMGHKNYNVVGVNECDEFYAISICERCNETEILGYVGDNINEVLD